MALAVRAPEDIGLLPDNGNEPAPGSSRVSASTERSYTLTEATHTWRLWLLLLAWMAMKACGDLSVVCLQHF